MINIKKIALIIGIILIVSILYYFFIYKKGQNYKSDPFKKLKQNLGDANFQVRDNSIRVYFNDNKNTADFFTNGRVWFFNDKDEWLKKGSFVNDGKKIILDGGKVIESNSVLKNIKNAIL
jgi:hypothetical protein